ncbi:MAG: hypothetical protein P4L50_30670 [Anaerolineaceae bacterium]|nr:hypothetical protein [Anaerolineaceae bacterium]
MAVCNYPHPKNNGHSIAFHPCAFGEDGKTKVNLVVEAGEHEGIVVAEFDLDEIRDWRKQEVWGDAFRRPEQYKNLLSNSTEDVFERVNKQGLTFRQVRDRQNPDRGNEL